MKLTMYRQASKTRPDGTVVYKGEDALPYVDEQLFMVADGMGGAAAMRHQKFNQDMFDKEKIMSVLFQGTYEDYENPTFVKYVIDSFFEFFAVKDCYTENIYNMKKGGYFASRIATAIILHEILYNKEMSAENVLKKLSNVENKIELSKQLKALSNYFSEKMRRELCSIAQNANFVYEAAMEGLALLGTTLCATLYYETENYVDALYLTAGDSRPYVWSCENGLCQLLLDEEGSNGGMTNYIRANEGTDFTIRCNYFRFSKPCVLFNASDGCFDSGKFISQLAFEKLILEQAIGADSMDTLSRSLTEFFLEYGRHDDSSTIAMKLFGFESFEEFKKYAAKRMKRLNEDYFAVMPDLLDADYISEYEQCASTFPDKLASMKSRFEVEKSVVDYCTNYIRSGKYKPYIQAIDAIDAQIKEEKIKVKDAKKLIENIIAQNFSKFKEYTDSRYGMFERITSSKISSAEEKYNERAADYVTIINRYKTDFDETVQTLSGLLGQIFELGVPTSFEDYDEISFQIVESCERSMDELFGFFDGLKLKKLDIVKKLAQQHERYVRKNVELAQKHVEDVVQIRKMILAQTINVDSLNILEADKSEVKNAIEIIAQHSAEIRRLEDETKVDVLKDVVNTYWENNYVDVITQMVQSDDCHIESKLLGEAKALIQELNEQTKGIREKGELQKQLFSKYDEIYSMYVGGIAE